jgi:hypothetical protein
MSQKDFRNGKGTHNIETVNGEKRSVRVKDIRICDSGNMIVKTTFTEWVCVSVEKIE